MKEGKLTNIIAVPTSIATKNQAEGEDYDLFAQLLKENLLPSAPGRLTPRAPRLQPSGFPLRPSTPCRSSISPSMAPTRCEQAAACVRDE